MSETKVIDSMFPSVAPFRRDRTSNKARLTTLFNKGYAHLSFPSHHFTSSSSVPLSHGFSLSSVSMNSHLTFIIFQ